MSAEDDLRSLAEAISAGCTGWRVSHEIADLINPPVILLDYEVRDQITFGDVGDAKHDYGFTAMALVQRNDSRSGQQKLNELRDPTNEASLWQVLAASDVGDYFRVTLASKIQVVDAPTADTTSYLGVEFTVEALI